MMNMSKKWERLYGLTTDEVFDALLSLADFMDDRAGWDHKVLHEAFHVKRAEVKARDEPDD